MPETEFLAIGDLHLNSLTNIFPEMSDPNELIFQVFEVALQYAKENGIRNIVQQGDIFETPFPSQESQCDLIRFFAAHPEFYFFVIPGNHDFSDVNISSLLTTDFIVKLGVLKHVKLFMKPTIESIDNIPFCFLPFPHNKRLKYREASINIAHIEKSGAVRDNGSKIEEGVSINIKNGDLWYIGHLHRHQKYERIIYSGTMFQKNFGEPLPKGFVHANVRFSKGRLSAINKYLPVQPPFELHNVVIEKPSDLKRFDQPSDSRPFKRYSLIVKDDIGLPPSFLSEHPEIVKFKGFKTKIDLAQIEQSGISLTDMPILDIRNLVFSDLPEYLRQKGLNKPERKRARIMVEDEIKRLGLML